MFGLIYGILSFIFRLMIIIFFLNVVLKKYYLGDNKNILLIVNYLLENLYIEDINLNDELSNKILFKY